MVADFCSLGIVFDEVQIIGLVKIFRARLVDRFGLHYFYGWADP